MFSVNKVFHSVFVFLILLSACKAKKQAGSVDSTPACIHKAIEVFSKGNCEKNISVKEYTFQNKQVFVFDQSLCGNDMTSEVLDNSCKSLGYLGGFAGNTLINGEDFSNALFVKTIWEK